VAGVGKKKFERSTNTEKIYFFNLFKPLNILIELTCGGLTGYETVCPFSHFCAQGTCQEKHF
jgi:hypothetical protein